MALIKCKECGKEISDKATACPHCGCPVQTTDEAKVEIQEESTVKGKDHSQGAAQVKKKKKGHGCLMTIIVFVLICVAVNVAVTNDAKDRKENPQKYDDSIAAKYIDVSSEESSKIDAVLNDCGIMISASHNPFYDNGIKVINGNGQKLEASVEAKIEEYIDGKIPELPFAKREDIGRTVDFSAGRNRYIGYLISIPTRAFKNKRVGLDCSNGSASAIAKSVFDALGAKTYVINNEPDGTNINMNCGSTHIEVLKQFVKDNQLDVGFAYDGDADRCIAVDDKGEEINGDLILYVCGKYMKEQGKLNNNTIVTTIMSNLGLYKACDREGISYEKTAVGDKYVCENMMQNGHSIGGEQSGHIIFSKHATTGDGILTSLKIMEVIIEKKLPLSTLASEVKIYPQVLKNVRVYDKKEARENPEVVKVIKKVEEALGEDGRILVRESGTEPVVRVMVEASTDEICNQYVDEVIAVMRAQNLVQ